MHLERLPPQPVRGHSSSFSFHSNSVGRVSISSVQQQQWRYFTLSTHRTETLGCFLLDPGHQTVLDIAVSRHHCRMMEMDMDRPPTM